MILGRTAGETKGVTVHDPRPLPDKQVVDRIGRRRMKGTGRGGRRGKAVVAGIVGRCDAIYVARRRHPGRHR